MMLRGVVRAGRLLLLLPPPGVGCKLPRVDRDAGFATKPRGCGVLAAVMKRLELAERGDGAVVVTPSVGRELLVGTGVAGARWVLGESCAPSAPPVSLCCRLMSGDLKGFRRVALAASIRRRLAAGPPGVWNDILRIVAKAHLGLVSHCFVWRSVVVFGCVQEAVVLMSCSERKWVSVSGAEPSWKLQLATVCIS
jgi:hypothetical protein